MKKLLVIILAASFGFFACSKSPEKEAAEIEKAAKILLKASDIQAANTKARTAVSELNIIAMSLADYITDKGAVPPTKTPGGDLLTEDSLIFKALVPVYSSSPLPVHDPWGFPFEIYFGKDCEKYYGIKSDDPTDFLIISTGAHKRHEKWTFDPSNNQAGIYEEFDENKNFANYNGLIIRGIKK